MLVRSFLEMVLLAQGSNRLNLHVLSLTKMVYAIQEELTVESMFGIRSKTLVLFLKLMLVKSLLLLAIRVLLFLQEKMICFPYFSATLVNTNSLDKLPLKTIILLPPLIFWMEKSL